MSSVEGHYSHGRLVRAIGEGLAALGRTPPAITIDDLAPVDEFHIGGRQCLHVVMGPDAALKARNMSANIEAGTIAPVEIVARRP